MDSCRRRDGVVAFADTVSVLQQAPGMLITRAPDEVQWACGGRTADGLRWLGGDDGSARYFRYLTRGDSPGARVARGAAVGSSPIYSATKR
ncbi:hypothetical protein EVAR_42_1 [Eumeta japonica]|uniref:Uncharacterized protein n=1 Tax=Eumeta variegata TaxID=151549 RepID=A0A4C1S7R3_EUMVA|nr:hypothetical protein EVAR_42_1 [Eumeta japonica]